MMHIPRENGIVFDDHEATVENYNNWFLFPVKQTITKVNNDIENEGNKTTNIIRKAQRHRKAKRVYVASMFR